MNQDAQFQMYDDIALHAAQRAIDSMGVIFNAALDEQDRGMVAFRASHLLFETLMYDAVRHGMPIEIAQGSIDMLISIARKAMEEREKNAA